MGKAQGALMGASMVAMMGSMAPGKVGEMSQKLIMPLMGLSMVLPLLQNKFGALAVGVGAVVAAYAYLRMAFDKAQDSTMKLTEANGVGTAAMIELSKSAGKVSATEAMDRKRKDKFNLLPIQVGKSTFGQSFVQQQVGKNMIKNIGQSVAANNPQIAREQTASQLMNAVAAGAMTVDQARSVAEELGKQLGDYNFGIQVNGKLTELLGQNGENLLEDPLGVRVKLIQDSRERLNAASTSSKNRGGWTVRDAGQMAAGAGVGAAVGGIGGAIAGGIIGSLAGPGGTVAGAVIGAKIGAVFGTVAGGLIGKKARNERIATASGASVAMDKMALEQGQQMIDSFDMQYQKKIELLKAQGKINEAVEKENDYYRERETLLAENKLTKDTILKNYSSSQGETKKAYETGVDKAITKKYKGTIFEDMAPEATALIKDAKLNSEQKMSLKLELESGAIDPFQMIQMFNTFTEEKDQKRMLSIIGKFGGKFAGETVNVVNGFTDSKGNVVPELQSRFTVAVNAKTTNKEAQEFQDFYGKLTAYDNVIDAAISVDYFLNNPNEQIKLQGVIDQIEKTNGEMDINIAANIIGGDALKALTADSKYFNSLDKNQKVVYTTALATQLSLQGDADQQAAFKAWQAANKGKGPVDYLTYATTQATAITKGAAASGLIPSGGGNTESKKTEGSILDDLLRKLKELRKIQIKVTEGWNASKKALNNLFSGNKELTIFQGMKQQMRAKGAGEDLISLIAGMDPKEYEKRKKELFEFDKKGNIVKLKETALSVGKALKEIALGEFQNKQQQVIKDVGNQSVALTRLIASGMSVSDAYAAVEDSAFAAAVASKKLTDEELKKITNEAKKAAKALKEFEAIKGLKASNTDFKDQIKLLGALGPKIGQYNNAQIKAILENKDLQTMLLNPTFDQTEFNTRLQQILDESDVKLAASALTIEGLEGIFSDGFNKAMEEISAKEQEINLKFNADTNYLTDIATGIIPLAENEIAKLQYQIDDWQAGLKGIETQEEAINKTYDAKFAALDKIEKANDIIARQQKNQLTLAGALTQGDIAAAAQAAQEMRAQNASDAIEQQRAGLDSAKELALLNIKNEAGFTRLQIEDKIKSLELEVFNIEEKRLEPARESLRLKERDRDIELSNVTSLGRTREEWEKIKNGIDLAKTRSAEYQAAIQAAFDVVKDITKYWNDLNGKKIKTYHEIITTYTGGNSAGGPAPKPEPKPEVKPTPNQTTTLTAEQQAKLDTAKGDLATGKAFLNIPGMGVVGKAMVEAATDTISILTKDVAANTTKNLLNGGGFFKSSQGFMSSGGLVPKYFASGGFAMGTDIVPAMLTPGEFVMSKYAVSSHGLEKMKAMNTGSSVGDTVYNYDLSVNVKSDANPDDIARTVMMHIKQIDSQKLRGNRI
jgi:ABC-type transporter Mla MlaB component